MKNGFIEVGEGAERRRIAWSVDGGDETAPAVLWCNGLRSDMASTKATAAAGWAGEDGYRLVRFDYSGHGLSGGAFTDGTISRWAAEAEAVLATVCADAPFVVIVGSSMGGWIALLLALALKNKEKLHFVRGLVLIAPAPDFTEKLMEPEFDETARLTLARDGQLVVPSAYTPDDPLIITQALIDDGRRNSLLDRPVLLAVPVHILQGKLDPDVPYRHALRLVETLAVPDVTLTLVPEGDHRLSRPQDLAKIREMIRQTIRGT